MSVPQAVSHLSVCLIIDLAQLPQPFAMGDLPTHLPLISISLLWSQVFHVAPITLQERGHYFFATSETTALSYPRSRGEGLGEEKWQQTERQDSVVILPGLD